MNLFKKFTAFLALLATVAAFAVSVSAAETYTVEGITLSKGQYKAYEYAVSQAEESGMTVDHEIFAKAAATVDYAGLQARRRTDGKTGIRSLYNVDQTYIGEIEAQGYDLSFGALMGMAEYYGESYAHTPNNMEITLDGDMLASAAAEEKAAAVTVYATSGKQNGVFTNATQRAYAYTTTYGGEYENFLPYTQIGLVYRGFLALRDVSGNTTVFYYDGIGDTFGNDCMYGVSTSAMDVYSYFTTYGDYGEDAEMLAVSECARQTLYVAPDAVDGVGSETKPFTLGEALSQVEIIMANNDFGRHIEFELVLAEGKYILTEEATFDGAAFVGEDYSLSIVGAGDGKTVLTSAIDVAPVNGIYNLPDEYMTDNGYLSLRSLLADGKMMDMATSSEYVMQYDAAKFTDTTFNEGGRIISESGALVAEEDEVLYLDATLLETLTSSSVDGTKHYIPGTEIWIKVEWQVQAVVLDYYDTSKTMTALDGTTTLYAAHVRHDNWTRLLNTDGSGRNYYSTLAGRGYTLRNNAGLLTENTFTYDASSGQFQIATVDGVSYSAPVLTRLLAFENAKNVTVTGIDFTGTTDTFTSKYGYVTGQTGYQKAPPAELASDFSHSTFLPFAAVYGKHVENITVDNCSFYDVGVDAIQLQGATVGATVTNNSFVDVGSSAVRIGNNYTRYDVSGKRYSKDITIEQNYADRTGVFYPSSVAVAVYPVLNLKLNYNTLIDSAYSAISVGWSWSATTATYPTVVNVTNAEIAYNNIKGFMVSGMKDGGAIYVLGGNATSAEETLFNSMHHNYCEVTEDTSRAANDKSGTYTVLYHDGAASHWHTHHNVVYTLHDENPTKYSYISYQSIVGSQTYNCFSEYNYFINLDEEFRIFYGGLDKAELYNLRAENNILVEDAHEAYAMVEPHAIVTGAGCDGYKATYPVDCANGEHVYLRKAVLPNGENLAYPATTKTAAQYYALCVGCDEYLTGSDAHLLFAYGSVLAGDTHECVYVAITDGATLASAASCTSPATYYKSCVDCGATGSETFTVGAALAHTWNNSKKICSVCGTAQLSNATIDNNGRKIVVTMGMTDTVTSLTVTVPADKIHYSGLYVVNFDWVLSDLENNYVEVISPNSFMMVNRDKGASGGSYSTYGFYVYLEARKNNDITVNILNGVRATACNKVRFQFIETIASSLDGGTNTPREYGEINAAGIAGTVNVPKAGTYELVVFGGSPDSITMNISINGGTATTLTERPTDTKYYYTVLSKAYTKNYKIFNSTLGSKPHTGTSGFYYMSLGSYSFVEGENTVSVDVTKGRWCPSSRIGNPPTYIFLVSSDAETHEYTDWVLETSQTCEAGMVMTRTCECSECNGAAETVIAPATGHDYGMWHDVFADSCIVGHLRFRACHNCGAVEYGSTALTSHDYGEWQDVILSGAANLKAAATCTEPAQYYKVCSVCGGISTTETFMSGDALGHNFTGADHYEDGIVYRACLNSGCAEQNAVFTVPTATVPDFLIDVSDFSGSFTVPADKIWETGFYWVTLTGTTAQTSGYTYMYNTTAARLALGDSATNAAVTAYAKLFASKNRDNAEKNVTNAGSPDGFLYSVYLVAGMDNVITYTGATLTKARFRLAAPVSDDTVWFTSGKNDLTANEVSQASFRDSVAYQMRGGSILTYGKKLTVTTAGYYVLSTNVLPANTGSSITFTLTDADGNEYVKSISLTVIEAAINYAQNPLNGGSEAYFYAPNLTVFDLPAGEYTLTVTQTGGTATMIASFMFSPLEHICQPAVPYDVPATCTDIGLTGEGCPICAKGATVIPALGHAWGEVETVTDATCTETGVGTKTCGVCGETENVVIEAKGHAWSDTETVVSATCTEAEIRYTECTVCGKKTNERSVGEALGHAWGDVETVTDATCTETGVGTKTCGVCGETETVVIEAKGHAWSETETVVSATCTEAEIRYTECTVCGEKTNERSVGDALGHAWGDVETVTDATCTETGVGTKTCGVCGETETVVIEAKGHAWSETETVIPATCTEAEIRYTECTVCGEKTNERSVGDALGHAWGEVETVTDATCTSSGVGTKTCGGCGETETVVIPATGHDFGDDGVCDCGQVEGEEPIFRDEEVDIGDL